MSAVIEYQDLQKLHDDLAKAPVDIDRQMDQDLINASNDCVDIGQDLAHVRKGYMRQTIHALKVGNLHYIVFSDAHYTVYEINRPGVKGGTSHDWMSPAAEAIRDKYPDIIATNVVKLILRKR